jgi:YkoY family integral membrane protein
MNFTELFGDNLQSALIIILNLIVIESLLSVDNAAVLATMVLDLPHEQRKKALKYGIIGAYVFRGLALLLAGVLIKVWWLKPIGGLYLLYLAFDFFKGKMNKTDSDDEAGDENNKEENKIYKTIIGWVGQFWATVALIELMDMAFSIDNVFAAVAFTDKLGLIWIGVFIGILAMRFVAQAFVSLMEKYPFLEYAAFIVIAILGVKLTISIVTHFMPESGITKFLDSESTDLIISGITVAIFAVPLATSFLFNFPKKAIKE